MHCFHGQRSELTTTSDSLLHLYPPRGVAFKEYIFICLSVSQPLTPWPLTGTSPPGCPRPMRSLQLFLLKPLLSAYFIPSPLSLSPSLSSDRGDPHSGSIFQAVARGPKTTHMLLLNPSMLGRQKKKILANNDLGAFQVPPYTTEFKKGAVHCSTSTRSLQLL